MNVQAAPWPERLVELHLDRGVFSAEELRVSNVTTTSAFSQVFSSCLVTLGVEQPQLDETALMWASSS